MRDTLDLGFATEETARQRARTFEEPEWLLEDRLDAIRRYDALPAETNQLFTTYLDLRGVRFAEIEPYERVADSPRVETVVPGGVSGFLHVNEDQVVARALSHEARDAGVVVETFANALRAEPGLLAPLLSRGPTLPLNDKFAQLARAVAAVGVIVYVPDGVQLRQPIVVRWSAGAGGRGLYGVAADRRLAFADDRHHGALRLDLRAGMARYAFVSARGRTLDRGTVRCRPLE
jgi:Fe-S cluster assembly protein SufB